MRALALAFSWMLVAGTAAAQNRPPSPCEHYIPTGETLPRQELADRQTRILAFPNPVYSDRPVATAWPDEPVVILQECGLRLRVRTVRGEEGWIPTSMLPGELKLYDRARRRPPATEAECAQRLFDPRLVEACRQRLKTARDLEADQRSAVYLPAPEVTPYLAGKTIVVRPFDDPSHPITSYFAPDGEFFLMGGPGGMKWRGRWTLVGNTVCFPGAYSPCARVRKIEGGRMLWVQNGNPRGFPIERSDGDTAGTVAAVQERYPKAALPPVPEGLEGVATPSLGRR